MLTISADQKWFAVERWDGNWVQESRFTEVTCTVRNRSCIGLQQIAVQPRRMWVTDADFPPQRMPSIAIRRRQQAILRQSSPSAAVYTDRRATALLEGIGRAAGHAAKPHECDIFTDRDQRIPANRIPTVS